MKRLFLLSIAILFFASCQEPNYIYHILSEDCSSNEELYVYQYMSHLCQLEKHTDKQTGKEYCLWRFDAWHNRLPDVSISGRAQSDVSINDISYSFSEPFKIYMTTKYSSSGYLGSYSGAEKGNWAQIESITKLDDKGDKINVKFSSDFQSTISRIYTKCGTITKDGHIKYYEKKPFWYPKVVKK